MSSYMLIHGDCMDSFGLIHDHSVNLVLADPPYGITQNTWDVVLPADLSHHGVGPLFLLKGEKV